MIGLSSLPAWRRFIAAIEPWYNWGEIYVERMEGMHAGSDGFPRSIGEGPVRYFELQWFGVHFACELGRTPKAVQSVQRTSSNVHAATTNEGIAN